MVQAQHCSPAPHPETSPRTRVPSAPRGLSPSECCLINALTVNACRAGGTAFAADTKPFCSNTNTKTCVVCPRRGTGCCHPTTVEPSSDCGRWVTDGSRVTTPSSIQVRGFRLRTQRSGRWSGGFVVFVVFVVFDWETDTARTAKYRRSLSDDGRSCCRPGRGGGVKLMRGGTSRAEERHSAPLAMGRPVAEWCRRRSTAFVLGEWMQPTTASKQLSSKASRKAGRSRSLREPSVRERRRGEVVLAREEAEEAEEEDEAEDAAAAAEA